MPLLFAETTTPELVLRSKSSLTYQLIFTCNVDMTKNIISHLID